MDEITILTPPAAEPVTVEELKTATGIDADIHDDLLSTLITTNRIWCETYTRSTFVTTTYKMSFHHGCRQGDRRYTLWRPPLIAVASVNYLSAGSPQVNSSLYTADPGIGAVVYPTNGGFPNGSRVSITYTAGYGTPADVPAGIKLAIILMSKHSYYNVTSVNQGLDAIPLGVESLLSPYVLRYTA